MFMGRLCLLATKLRHATSHKIINLELTAMRTQNPTNRKCFTYLSYILKGSYHMDSFLFCTMNLVYSILIVSLFNDAAVYFTYGMLSSLCIPICEKNM